MRTFYGNFGVLVRAYAYIRALGPEGLQRVSETAVLNANYVMEGIKDVFDVPFERRCMHEFVASATPLKEHGVRALDVAKRLLDYGVHPPTTYFPLIVDEALMIEPTETESREDLDRLIEAFRASPRRRRPTRRCCARRRSRCRCGGSTRPKPPVTRCSTSGSRRTATAAPEAPARRPRRRVSVVKVLPELRANGAAQMALDPGLLETADEVIARRYTWAPPALSLGRFQEYETVPGLPFDVVRRPSGGRAVLHGEELRVVVRRRVPAGVARRRRARRRRRGEAVRPRGRLVRRRARGARRQLDGARASAYQRSALCFASVLRHDLSARGEKLVAVAQARRPGRVLVHGSVLERRPPDELAQVAETLLGEPWQGDGLAGAGYVLAAEMIWKRVLVRLEAALRGLPREEEAR